MTRGDLVRLFRPRIDQWSEHLGWAGAVLLSKTAIRSDHDSGGHDNEPDFLAVREAFDPRVDLPTRIVATMARSCGSSDVVL